MSSYPLYQADVYNISVALCTYKHYIVPTLKFYIDGVCLNHPVYIKGYLYYPIDYNSGHPYSIINTIDKQIHTSIEPGSTVIINDKEFILDSMFLFLNDS